LSPNSRISARCFDGGTVMRSRVRACAAVARGAGWDFALRCATAAAGSADFLMIIDFTEGRARRSQRLE